MTPEFTVTHVPYEVGYAYECQAAPSGEQTFRLVLLVDGRPQPSPLVESARVNGSGTTVVDNGGRQQLDVQTGAQCQWAVKVVAP
jgi:hypothetical protein